MQAQPLDEKETNKRYGVKQEAMQHPTAFIPNSSPLKTFIMEHSWDTEMYSIVKTKVSKLHSDESPLNSSAVLFLG